MKRRSTILISILLLSLTALHLFSNNSEDKPQREDKEAPPGTIKLSENLYIDKSPVSNASYMEFLSFVKRSYSQNIRDTLKNFPLYGITHEEFEYYIKQNATDDGLYDKMSIPENMHISWDMNQFEYLHHPYYEKHPVVNITPTQVKTFCEWRTDMVMLFYAVNSKDKEKRTKYYTKIKYRLPTKEEWILAMKTFSDDWIYDKLLFEHDKTCTYPPLDDRKHKNKFQYVPGNVAEMINEKDVAMGVSWYDKDTSANFYKTIKYTMPHDYLGFRCICEIVEY